MKDEKKVKATEEVKEEVKPKEGVVELNDEELAKVFGGDNFSEGPFGVCY